LPHFNYLDVRSLVLGTFGERRGMEMAVRWRNTAEELGGDEDEHQD
jgi:hypothetical protein